MALPNLKRINGNVLKSWVWSSEYEDETVVEVIKQILAKYLARRSSIQEDSEGVDYVIEKKEILCRLRTEKFADSWRDFTIRTRAARGGKTEITKIKEGKGKYYIYGWVHENRNIEFIVVDLDSFRKEFCGPDEYYKLEANSIPNGDGTEFVPIPIEKLRRKGCLTGEGNFLWTNVNRNKKQSSLDRNQKYE